MFILSAANDRSNNDDTFLAPAYLSRFFKNVVTVASVDKNNRLSSFSNYGKTSVQISAPGEQVYSSILGGNYGSKSGTSMASPKVAGFVASLRKKYPHLSPFDIRRIIGQSATKVSRLAPKTVTGGVLNTIAATSLASRWKGENSAITSSELKSINPNNPSPALPDSTRGPIAKGPIGLGSASAGHVSTAQITSGKNLTANAKFVKVIAGFSGNWTVVNQKDPNISEQLVVLPTKTPFPQVNKAFKDGYRITASGGDVNGWTFCLSKFKNGKAPAQKVHTFSQSAISKSVKEGYEITSVAGWKQNWYLTVTKTDNYGHQRYTQPSPYGESRIAWIKARWKEGYRITDVAGDRVEGKEGSWVFVLSEKSNYTDQFITDVGPWPKERIAKGWKDGYHISSVAGYKGHWLVVMSKSKKAGLQSYTTGSVFPSKAIEGEWAKK